jgi:phosphonate transport system substrate-binding protein
LIHPKVPWAAVAPSRAGAYRSAADLQRDATSRGEDKMADTWRRLARTGVNALVASILAGSPTAVAEECTGRGQLDTIYCDADNDLVADVPTDPKKLKDPSTLVFAYTPVEDPAVYQNVFKPFTDFLAQCTGKRVVYYPVQSNAAEIEAMRSGRLHVAGFSTGPTGFAVNLAGAVPFAAKGSEKGPHGYHLISIVRKDSPYQKLADLKGKRVAHTSPSSNSGHLAPLVLYPPEGLKPNEDYKPLMSGGHDKSALGVASGDYDMAGVASDVFERMVSRGTLKADDFRIIFTSPLFPTSSFAYAHDLNPDLAKKIRGCFFAFDFPPSMRKEFNGDDRFVPITYKSTWQVVREIAEASGTPYNKTAYDAESKREAEALAKKQQQQPAGKQ